MLLFDYDGETYEFDQDKLELAESIAVKVETGGMTIKAFQFGIQELDPEALKAMVWLSLRRAGVAIRYTDVTFDVVQFLMSLKNEVPDADADAADPTGSLAPPPDLENPKRTNAGACNGKTRKSAEQPTSGTSPIT